MKKILLGFVIALFATTTYAQHRHHHHHHHHRGHHNWVAPMIGGIVVGALIANQTQPVVIQPPVYVTPPVTDYYQCLVQVYDPITNTYRNEVRTCVR